ncbi:histidinolphosphatase-like protein [Hirsutella rhossiliensis]|uniref:Histidinolphosphatase-like protein n=1 Tax=Hirsutella rhossiliensis TaxID=111463 RepID=A0A9P8MTC4_9HYPO|nr:histidinolphosphatase-like protein [Hirsutella rhossiliensis]KAH0960804.1 histidinolphosphatase-like protein [Hirsutella rhossiliensis]
MAAPEGIALNLPSKYSATPSGPVERRPPPPTDWLAGTWTVTHSTLSMWRSARNVRISYTPLAAKPDGRARIDDLVEYEPTGKTGVRKTVEGVDTQAAAGPGWDWRGKGWLFFVGSHWEVLGWGEETTAEGAKERWAVTWFAPTLFTKEGLDVYCDQRQGLSQATYQKVEAALKKMEARDIVAMVDKDMRPVEIKLPWTEK